MAPLVGPTSEEPIENDRFGSESEIVWDAKSESWQVVEPALPGVGHPDGISVTDWRGNTYSVGSRVLYPRASGRSLEMAEARVVKITPYESSRYNYETNEREPVTAYKVTVDPIGTSRFSGGNYRSVEKQVTLQIATNITAVTN